MTMRRLSTLLCLLSMPFAAATGTIVKVSLSNLTQPSSGQALVGSVSVTGENFPAGGIPPANVTVSFQPATAGSGPSGSTVATSVSTISGTKRRVVFQIPAAIAVTVPTSYKVTIAGSTSSGVQFRSNNSAALTMIPPARILTLAPNSAIAGMTLSVAITGVYTNFVQATTVAGFGPGVSVGGAAQGQAGPVTVTSATTATAQIAISPTAAAGGVTVTVTTGGQIASLANGFTILPAAKITMLTPDAANAALSLPVTITGQNTNFVQGTTVASFGPNISVGGAAEGQAGPVTVTTPTTVTAQISIDPAATAGPATVTVTTGNQQVSLAGGFTIESAVAVVNLSTAATMPVPPNFSGFSDPYLLTGVEYTDPKYIAMLQPLKMGFLRYPGGLQSMAFDWQAAEENSSWLAALTPKILPIAAQGLELAQKMTQAKGGACFTATTGGSCFSNYADLANTLGTATLVDFNGWTDTNAGSEANMVSAASAAGLKVVDWELTNEPYLYPAIFPTAASYAAAQHPYATDFYLTGHQNVGVFYQGQFIDVNGNYQAWDSGMAAYTPHYWNAVSMHVYPISNATLSTSEEEQTLNGILAHGTNEYISSYVTPVIGAGTPLYLTEFNSDAFGTLAFESYIYNAIFLAEYIARMSTAANVKGIGVHPLFLGNSNGFNQGVIRAVDDYQSYLLAELQRDPNYTTDTATNPATQFQFYPSTNALALQLLNEAVNASSLAWETTVSGGPTVPILGYDGNPIPAVFAQGYQGTSGSHYLVITNKSGATVPIGIELNGTLGPASVTASYISSASDTAQNTATNQTAVQIVNTTWANPMTIGPYSVTMLEW